MGAAPKPRIVNLVNARNPTTARGVCFEYGGTDHYKASCPRLNRAPRQRGNRQNQAMAIEGGQCRGNNGNQARGGAFMMGAEEARQDPNIVMIKGHTFDIDLIPFGHRSFDVIVGMDWLSRHKAEIVCHEKVVRIPLPNGKTLRVLGEKPEEKMRHLMSAKTEKQKLKDIFVVRNFPEEVQFLGHVINGDGIHVDPNFSKIAKPLTILTQKNKTYDWGEEQEEAFQILKDKFCNAPVLALPDRPKDFILKIHEKNYTTHDLELGAVKELNKRQRRWIELFNDYDCEIRYHIGKENVVADALSRKERVKPKRFQAMNMAIQSSIKMEHRSDRAWYYLDRKWVPLTGDVRTLIIDKAHKSKYSVHPGADKMYYDLRDMYWWPRMKKDIVLMLEALGTRLDMSTAYHLQTNGQSERIIQTLEDMPRACCKSAPFEALYGRKCRSPILWAEVGEGQLIGLEIMQETTKKIS
ncbi:putative reverse transcriptase domain-containing protein [Tanacetum coccineum]